MVSTVVGSMSDDVEAEVPTHLITRAVRSHWLVMIVTGLLVSLAGVSYAVTASPSYASSAEILIQPIAGNPFSSDSLSTPQQLTVGLETEANLISSPDVTGRVSRMVDEDVPAGTSDVSASVVTNSQILRITYSATSRSAARAGADAFARAFLASRGDKAKALRDQTVASIGKQIADLQKQLNDASKAASGSAASSNAAARVQSLTNRLATLEEGLSTAQATSTYPGSIVSPASQPSGMRRYLPIGVAAVAILLGFALGFALSVLRAWIDDRIDSRYELYVAGLPIWAAVGKATPAASLVLESETIGAAEPYRTLRSAVIANVSRPCVIAITSVEPMNVIADVSSNLAVYLAEAGYRCAIIDAGINAPRVASLFGRSGGRGLSDVISGAQPLERSSFTSHGVVVLPSGPPPSSSLEKYSGESFRSILAKFRREYDYVVVAVADLSSAIGMATAGVADTAVLVVGDGVTKHRRVAEVVERAHTQKVNIGGVVAVSPTDPKLERDVHDVSRHAV